MYKKFYLGGELRSWLMMLPIFIILLIPNDVLSQQVIRVGGYLFPPFVVKDEDGALSGATLDLIDLLNASQDEYYFDFYLTTAARRHKDFIDRKYDVIFFEDKRWGWGKLGVQETDGLIDSSQVYIANRNKAKSQDYFHTLKNKLILGVRGYNYGFANFVGDPGKINRLFNVRLVTNPEVILPLVLKNSVDVSMISSSYVLQKSLEQPEILSSIIISEKLDRSSRLGLLVGNYSKIPLSSMNKIISNLVSQKTFQLFWLQQYLEVST